MTYVLSLANQRARILINDTSGTVGSKAQACRLVASQIPAARVVSAGGKSEKRQEQGAKIEELCSCTLTTFSYGGVKNSILQTYVRQDLLGN